MGASQALLDPGHKRGCKPLYGSKDGRIRSAGVFGPGMVAPRVQKPLQGRATPEGTRRYAHAHAAAAGHYRQSRGLTVSSLGHGTYLGDVSPEAGRAYEDAILASLHGGVNVVDTASNYRHMESERDVGRALARFGKRDEVVVVTKGGFIPYDAQDPVGPRDYARRTYYDSGLLRAEDVVGGVHSLAPEFLRHELDRSRANMGLWAVDAYLLHNVETQLTGAVPRATVEQRILTAFEWLEREVDQGHVGVYGLATWDAFRVNADHPAFLSLERMLELATQAREKVGSGKHHFGAVELPVNVAMPEAIEPRQTRLGAPIPFLEAAAEEGLMVLASATLLQTRLFGRLPPYVAQALGTATDVQTAIEFTRGAPGVTTALVGMSKAEHARSNAALAVGHSPNPKGVATLLNLSV